jgi:sugar phosphate permease
MPATLRGMRAVRVFVCFALCYLLSYALRSINAVIAPSLLAEFGMSNADLGLLSSAYFVAFGCMQLPLGIWLDKYGARRTEAVLLVFAAAGAAVFATSTSLTGLWVGRALIGIGVSACLMAALKAYRQWFALEQQAQLASWMLVSGTAGALTATLPVTLALPLICWRGVFWVIAAMLLLLAGAIFLMLRDVEASFAHTGPLAVSGSKDGGYRSVFGNRYFWRMGALGLVNHGIFFALQTLWAGPWMMTVLGKTQQQTAQILFALNLMLLLSYLALGWSAPRLLARGWNVHRLIAIGIAGMLLAQCAMLLTTAPWAWMLWLPLVLCVPVTTLVQSNVGMAFPPALAGRANSAYNLQLFIGAFATQWGFGLLIDALKGQGFSAVDAFRVALGSALALQAIALAYFVYSAAVPGETRQDGFARGTR